MCKVLKLGDEIIQIDGYDTPTKEAIMLLLRGSDVPGSKVNIAVKRV
jgi:C-terminal processing protease CtpA/Prc